jgi:hypothetical protein
VRIRDFRLATASATAGTAAIALLAACSPTVTPAGADTSSTSAAPPTGGPTDARSRLAARAAAAKDRRYKLGYTLTPPANSPNKANRSVLVTIATDGTWRVDIQGGALGGTADVSIAQRPEGQYQCTLTGAAAGCVKVAEKGKKIPPAIDPRVQNPFTSWLDVLTDRQVPLTVSVANPLPASTGQCFAVDPAVTAVQPPIEGGVLCYTDDGTLTAAKMPFGTLVMAGQPGPPDSTIALPGPVTNGAPLGTAVPSAPAVAPSRS